MTRAARPRVVQLFHTCWLSSPMNGARNVAEQSIVSSREEAEAGGIPSSKAVK